MIWVSWDFPYDLIACAPARYTAHDTQELHPISIALVISLKGESPASVMAPYSSRKAAPPSPTWENHGRRDGEPTGFALASGQIVKVHSTTSPNSGPINRSTRVLLCLTGGLEVTVLIETGPSGDILGRVDRWSFTFGPSENRTGTSQFIRLLSFKPHGNAPRRQGMNKSR